MLDINQKNQRAEEEQKIRVLHQKKKTGNLRAELANQKVSYESQIRDMLAEKQESNLDLTKFYHQKIEFLDTELLTSMKIRGILEKNIERLMHEV